MNALSWMAAGFSAVVGVFFGFYPARRASKLLPIQALRHEGMNKRIFLALSSAVLLAGCASVPRTVEVPREKLQAALDKRFPAQARFLELLEVQLSAPRLQLQPESNRLRTDFGLQMSDRIVRRALQGNLDLSFGLRYEPSDASIRLTDVRVERLDLRGLPEQWAGTLTRLGPFVTEKMLESVALHSFTPEELNRAQGWTPGELRVTSTGVRITLQPPAR